MTVHEILLEFLDELDSKEMDLFTWHLTKGVNDFKIPKSQLENKQRFEVVTCMIQRYPDGAGNLTLLVLEKMKQMNLAKELQEKLGERQILNIFITRQHLMMCRDLLSTYKHIKHKYTLQSHIHNYFVQSLQRFQGF
uniref:Pyrin domain-containing protein n=1 Tax=Cyprinus carpio TaxID=7962 RepID=A0A8C1QFB1_CYPCA